MQKLEKILEEMKKIKDGNRKENLYAKYPPKDEQGKILNAYSQGYEDGTDNFYNAMIEIIRKHMNDGWIPVEERLPEDVYTPSELYEKQFLVTTPFGEERVVQRARCVPTGYVWFDGYDSVRVSAWRYIKPYRPERRDKAITMTKNKAIEEIIERMLDELFQ